MGRVHGWQSDLEPVLFAALSAAVRHRRGGRAPPVGAASARFNNPLGIDKRGPQDTIPFHPYYTHQRHVRPLRIPLGVRDTGFYLPNMLSSADNYIPANPMVTPNHIVPEWYLLPIYAILRSITFDFLGIPSKLLAWSCRWARSCCVSGAVARHLAVRSARFRPIWRWFAMLLPLDLIALGYVGSQPPAGFVVTLGQIATAYYYIHFLILLPLIGKIETPRPLPISIGAAVLAESTEMPGAAQPRLRSALVLCGGICLGSPSPRRAAAPAASAMVVQRRLRTYDRARCNRLSGLKEVCASCHPVKHLYSAISPRSATRGRGQRHRPRRSRVTDGPNDGGRFSAPGPGRADPIPGPVPQRPGVARRQHGACRLICR